MLTPEENDLLCRVEGDAPMGRLMRQHWIPALLSEEVTADGKPVRVRLLGQNMVAFRDTNGKVGILDEQCPHRRASLVFGRNEDCGLRCLYHGWKFDVDGNVTEMFSEPPDSPMHGKVKHKAYPVRELAGFVWVYLGDEATMPEFERPPFSPDDETPVSILKIVVPCNWAQITEGQIDSAHSSSLHSSDMVPARVDTAKATEENWLRPSTDKSPRLQVQRTPYGFRYAALRRPIKNARTHVYARVTVYVAPFISLIPPNTSYNVTTVIVPIDDETSAFHFLAWGGTDCPDTQTWREFNHAVPGVDLDEHYRTKRTLDNDFLQDREMMAETFTGIPGIPNQDIAMWVGMGPIVDRSKDVLGTSDLAVVEFRRLMVEAAQNMADRDEALGTGPDRIPQVEIASAQQIIPLEQNWRSLAVQDAEAAAIEAINNRMHAAE